MIFQSGLDIQNANWVEPFFGTGVVGFNSPVGGNRIVGDTNPHIINFYNEIMNGEITPQNMRTYLEREGQLLLTAEDSGYAYYREVKNRFNQEHSPFDFIFLSRAGFNGMMRFNRRGEWNIPFCKKPNRFLPAYITKICNQVEKVQQEIHKYNWEFDDRGNIVNAHGACIVEDNGRYYLFGEWKSDKSNAFPGFSCYSSDDLVNWKFENVVLQVQPNGILGPNRVGERVKVMKCPKT